MPDDESSIFGNLPGLRDDDEGARARRARTRLYMRMRGPEEGPLRPRPWGHGVGGPSINQGAPPPTLPVNTTAPVISGTTTVGSTLSCTTGAWTNSPTSYTYQWQRGGANISGATASTYLTVTADGGTSLTCNVTATNASGSASAASNALPITAPASTWSTADAAASSPAAVLSNGNMTAAYPGGPNTIGSGWVTVRNTTSHNSGKWYFECLMSANPSIYMFIGVASGAFTPNNPLGGGIGSSFGIRTTANGVNNFTAQYTVTFTTNPNDVLAIAVDFTAGSVWIAQNNVWMNSSNPATGTLPIATFSEATVGALFAAFTLYSSTTGSVTLQPTAASQKYAPPAGFSPWG